MLQQILKDLYVDPEILSELDEQQKQTLFCKMREEQVRRWTLWDTEVSTNPNKTTTASTKETKKSVSFLKGTDGEPWVWVMGEHEGDRSIEDILKEETMEKARKLAEKEAEELRKRVEEELKLSEYMNLTPKIEEDIYCSVEELRDKMNSRPMNMKYTLGHYQNNNNSGNNNININMNKYSRDVLNELSKSATQKVAQRVALWEKRLTEERTCEILKKMQIKRLEAAKEAEEAEIKQEEVWKEQERKAKEAEQQIREIARRAREEHRLTSGKLELDTAYSAVAPGVPPGRQAVLEWYKTQEIPRKSGLDDGNNVEPWFHGLITRGEAERLLLDHPDGTFLVRLSERIWGYAISYRSKEKCKHYLVNAGQSYCFLGNNQKEHKTLGDLIAYHKTCPLSGGEKLVRPCPRDAASNGHDTTEQPSSIESDLQSR